MKYLTFVVISACLSSFLFGFNNGIVNQTLPVIVNCASASHSGPFPSCISMGDWEQGLFVSIFLVGGIVGGALGSYPSACFGRRLTLLLNILFYAIGAAFVTLGFDLLSLSVGRFVSGVASGISTVVVPVYVNEVSPIHLRGILGTIHQLCIVLGSLVVSVLGLWLANNVQWRFMFGSTWVACLLQLTFLPLCPESPVWLIQNNRSSDARRVLTRLGRDKEQDDDTEVPSDEDESIESAQSCNSKELPSINTIAELFCASELRWQLFAALSLQMAQQLSGINAAVYFSTRIFMTNFSAELAVKLTLVIVAFKVFFTILSMRFIESVGRRPLLLTSISLMCMSSILTGLLNCFGLSHFYFLAALSLYCSAYSIGLGAIPWLILPELIPSYAIKPASSVSVTLNWSTNAILTLVMPKMIQTMGYNIFWVFGGLLVVFFFTTLYCVPETKSKTAQEVSDALSATRRNSYVQE